MPQIIALGDTNLDLVAHISHYPPPGGDGLTSTLLTRSGGSAANVARALASCGVSAGLISRIGSDALAQQLLDELRAAGVDVSFVQRDPALPSGLMFIAVTPDGQRTMFGYRGANARTSPDQLDLDAIRSARWLHISGYAFLEPPQAEAALRALTTARRAHRSVSIDLGLEVILREPALVDMLLPHTSAIFPNRDEARALVASDDPPVALERLRDKGPPLAVLKLGGDGCALRDGLDLCYVPAFDVDVMDTTGAGDAFAAGFLAGQVRGLDLRACALWANAMGALAASVEGGAVPGPGTVVSFLRQYRRQPGWRNWKPEFDAILAVLEPGPG